MPEIPAGLRCTSFHLRVRRAGDGEAIETGAYRGLTDA
jgi:hypothetical protein